jgi:hypothetical protein
MLQDGIERIPAFPTHDGFMARSSEELQQAETNFNSPYDLLPNYTSNTSNFFSDHDPWYGLDHDDASLSGCSGGTSSVSSGGSNSSAGSESSMFNNRKGKRSRRFTGYDSGKSDSRDRSRLWCTCCWKSLPTCYDWKRHEESVHIPLKAWICDLEVYLQKFGADGRWRYCRLCRDIDIGSSGLSEHFVTFHRVVECTQQPLQKRLFSRKDHLKQHLSHFHGMKGEFIDHSFEAHTAHTDSKGPFLCGFCLESIATWEIRADHIATHFTSGWLVEEHWRISRTWTMSSQKHLKAHQELLETTKSALREHPISNWPKASNEVSPVAYRAIRELINRMVSANQEFESGLDATSQQPSSEYRGLIDCGTLAQMGAFHAAIDVAKRLPLRDWQSFLSLLIHQVQLLAHEIGHSEGMEVYNPDYKVYSPDYFRRVRFIRSTSARRI